MKIFMLVFATLFILGCSQEKNKEQRQSEQKIQKEVVQKVQKNVEQTVKPVVEKKVQEIQKEEKVEKVEKMPVVEVPAVKTEIVSKEVAVIDKAEVDGAKIFVKCAGCHGKNGEKKALGKSQAIGGWDEAKTASALHGYKDGTYGAAMKSVMKAQVSNLSDSEINAVAKYISKL